jgi:hypothetical protein
LLEPLPISLFEYVDLNGQTNLGRVRRRAGAINGRPHTPCMKELSSRRKATLDRLKVRIVAGVDALSQTEPPDAIKSTLAGLNYPFDAGWANKPARRVDGFRRRVVYRQRTLPLPQACSSTRPAAEPQSILAPWNRECSSQTSTWPPTYRQQAVPFAGRWARDLSSHPIAVASSFWGGYSADARAYIDSFSRRVGPAERRRSRKSEPES